MVQDAEFAQKVKNYVSLFDSLRKEISKNVVGQSVVINGMIKAIIANGHVLLEGVPGVAKTYIIRTLSAVSSCDFSRVQFTPDLLPTDIIGITAFEKEKGFYVIKGPIFSNFVLADEINRAPPKVQSALLESMQERQVTIGKEIFQLDPPFFVLATQNPIESLGTYPLPEAQVDRFLFKIEIDYPNLEEEQQVLIQNMTLKKFEKTSVTPILDGEKIMELQQEVHKIYVDKKVEKYIVSLVDATRNPEKYKVALGRHVEFGSSPRGSIGLYIASKAEAMINGKLFVTPNDVKNVAHDVLRHRIILTYQGQAEGVIPDHIITEILSKVPVP